MSNVQTRTTLWHSASLWIEDFVCQVGPHSHGVEEVPAAHHVVFLRSGAFLRTIGTESVLADPTHVLFFTRAEPYRVTHPITGGDRCTIVSVAAETLLEIGRRHDPRWPEDPDAPFASRHALNTARTVLLHQALLRSLRRAEMRPLATHELTLELLGEVLGAGRSANGRDRGPTATISARGRELAEAAKTVLSERYPDPPSLEDLAQTLGCSPFHLCRSFSRTVGLPLRRYLDRLRLRLAMDRLAAGEPDLTTLALDLGYADHSHFTNAFRREFGRPPSALRVVTAATRRRHRAAAPSEPGPADRARGPGGPMPSAAAPPRRVPGGRASGSAGPRQRARARWRASPP